ncbi:uncharacterized protein LOC144859164 [Branchiostoma floridae x Branchiostoma japonicum]
MRVIRAILLGCALLVPATSSDDSSEKQTKMEHNLLQILADGDMEKQHELSERVEDIIYELKNLAADNDEEQEDMNMSEKSLPLDDDSREEQSEVDMLEDNLPRELKLKE